MITVMRRYRRVLRGGLLVVIAAFVLTSVYVGSMSGGARNRGDVVATVNGEAIPVERYQRRYQAYLDAYSRVYRDRFSPTLAEQLGLPQQAVNDLVQEAVVVQRARVEGLEVSDEELNAQIQAVPAFAENGRFSLARYQDFLRRRGMSASAFENDVRRELTRMKVETTVKAGIKVSDAELERAFALRREEVRAAWALVETAPLVAAATVSDEEVAEYLKAHPAEFQLPERRRVQYVTLAPKDFRPQIPEAEVEKYYTEHAKDFETPRQVHAAHVLVVVPQTGGSEAEDKARAKVADVIRRAKAGEDFGKLAAELSEDPGSKPKGGDLGWISKGEMVPAFEAVAFTLGRGELTPEPVRTPFGFHAIKVLEVRPGGKKPLKDVAPQIRDRLAAEAADKAARAKADEVKPALQAAKDFVAEARRLGLTPVETTMSKVERIPMLGGSDERSDGGGEECGRADRRDGALLSRQTGRAPARRRAARRAAVAGGRRRRAGEVAAGLLRAEGARARGAEHGGPRSRARPNLPRGAHAEAEPGVGGVGQPGPRGGQGRGPGAAEALLTPC